MRSKVVLIYREVTSAKEYPSGSCGYETDCYLVHGKRNSKVHCYESTIWKDSPTLDDDGVFLISKGFLYKVLFDYEGLWK